ncbi:unnamed protein product [Notodromas monacha]|uniref:Uncharacterized protein n=1 Tax=Notodromas monacha TaxID=399045 RepID=A0A7R9BMF3_9CRUS|nr:unnamed protein product [Notodromas monacha]CAG0917292.1 unnamed protein product [Notodromas monacha]
MAALNGAFGGGVIVLRFSCVDVQRLMRAENDATSVTAHVLGSVELNSTPERVKSPTARFSLGPTTMSKQLISRAPMKDYEEIVEDLRKENFDLKLRVHLLEERCRPGGGSAQDDSRKVIDLKVEAENLRLENAKFKELLSEASLAIETLQVQHEEAVARIIAQHEADKLSWSQKDTNDTPLVNVPEIPVVVGPNEKDELLVKIASLQEELNDMRARVVTAEDEAQVSRNELTSKISEVQSLHATVSEKDERIEKLSNAMNVKEKEVAEKEKRVQSVQEELKTVKPEILTKTREIEDKDKIIEEKNSQLEQQQKILVEIQITLDEKQKELDEYERKLRESREKLRDLEDQLSSQIKAAQSAVQELEKKNSDLKRRDRRIRDLEAQMKELQDSLNKAKWEAEQGGSEGGVKEMAEEEMETLWTQLEEMKKTVSELTRIKQEKEVEIQGWKTKVECLEKQLSNTPSNQAFKPDSSHSLVASMPQQSIHIQPQFAVESADVATLRAAFVQLREQLEAKAAQVESSEISTQGKFEMELWSKNDEIAKLQKQMDKMSKFHEKDIANLRETLDDKDKELSRLKDKARKLRAALEDSRKEANHLSSLGKENSGSSSCNELKLAVAKKPMQETNPNVIHIHQAAFADVIPASMVPLLAACHEETVEALKSRIVALQDALTSKLDNEKEVKQQLKSALEKVDALEKERQEVEMECSKNLDFDREQVEALRVEVRQLRQYRDDQLEARAVDWRKKYQSSAKKYKKELAIVRQQLADSHNACAMLRTRLEELADFLDQILVLEDQGLLDLSHVSADNVSAMRRALDNSRNLSQSLSQSLVVSVIDEEPACRGDDDDLISFSSQASSFGLRDDGSPATPEADETGADRGRDELIRIRKEIEDKNQQLLVAGEMITKLRGETTRLAEGIRARDLEIEKLILGTAGEPTKESGAKRSVGARSLAQDRSGTTQASPGTRRKGDTSPAGATHRSHHHHHHRSLPSKSVAGQPPAPNRRVDAAVPVSKPLSPSESEAWSEPDRNVSLARIGLDQEARLKPFADDELQAVGQVSTSSSSDADSQKLAGNSAASLARVLQQNRNLMLSMKTLQAMNDSLKAELVACHAALGRGEGDQELFSELKALRENLEETIANHDEIKRHLQESVAGNELREEKERLRAAMAQAERYRQLCDHSETQINAVSQRNEELEKEVTRLRKELVTNKAERDKLLGLEDWYEVKAVEIQSKDQKKHSKLQEALLAAEIDKKELKIQLNEARATSERYAKEIEVLEIRCKQLEEELHRALDELRISRETRAELEKDIDENKAESDAKIASLHAENAAKCTLLETEKISAISSVRVEFENKISALKSAAELGRDLELRLEEEKLKCRALEANYHAIEEQGRAALMNEKSEHLALVIELKREIQAQKEKANDLESRYVELSVENQRLVEAKNYADALEAKRRQYLDKSLQVDDFDGTTNGLLGGMCSPESGRSVECVAGAVSSKSQLFGVMPGVNHDQSHFQVMGAHTHSPGTYSSPDQGIETEPHAYADYGFTCPDCHRLFPLLTKESDENAASLGILEVELKIIREENSRLLSELADSKHQLRDALAKLQCPLDLRKDLICQQLHKTHDVLRKASITSVVRDCKIRSPDLRHSIAWRFLVLFVTLIGFRQPCQVTLKSNGSQQYFQDMAEGGCSTDGSEVKEVMTLRYSNGIVQSYGFPQARLNPLSDENLDHVWPPASVYRYSVECYDGKNDPRSRSARERFVVSHDEIRRCRSNIDAKFIASILDRTTEMNADGYIGLKQDIADKSDMEELKLTDVFVPPKPVVKKPPGRGRRRPQEAYIDGSDSPSDDSLGNSAREPKSKVRKVHGTSKKGTTGGSSTRKSKKKLIKDDLEIQGLKVRDLPRGTAVTCHLPDRYFGDVIQILEFISAFGESLGLDRWFPDGISFEVVERTSFGQDAFTVVGDLFRSLLTVALELRDPNPSSKVTPPDSAVVYEGEIPQTPEEVSRFSSDVGHWISCHLGATLRQITSNSYTVSELLRLHVMSSGSSEDDPALQFIIESPPLIEKLKTVSIFELTFGEIIALLNLLISQITATTTFREQLDTAMEKRRKKGKRGRPRAGGDVPQENGDHHAADDENEDGVPDVENIFSRLPLGYDRAFRSYWMFSSVPGLFVEDIGENCGPCLQEPSFKCKANDSSPQKSPAKSSKRKKKTEIERDPTLSSCAGWKNRKNCRVHSGFGRERSWYYYSTPEELEALIGSLHPEGTREGQLRSRLLKGKTEFESKLNGCPKHLLSVENGKSSPDIPSTLNLDSVFREKLLEMEEELRLGNLGFLKVPDIPKWRNALATGGYDPQVGTLRWGSDELLAEDDEKVAVRQLSAALLQVEQGINCNHMRYPFGKVMERKKSGARAAPPKDNPQSEPKIYRWEKSLQHVTSYSQLFVHLHVIYDAVLWSRSVLKMKCGVCRKMGDGSLIICDDCNAGYHTYCLRPPMRDFPGSVWYCRICQPLHAQEKVVTHESETEADEEESKSETIGLDDSAEELEGDCEEEEEEEDDKENLSAPNCHFCAKPGELVQCASEECDREYHLECAQPPLRRLPRHSWFCHICKAKAERPSASRKHSYAEDISPRRKNKRIDSYYYEDDDDYDQDESGTDDDELSHQGSSRTGRRQNGAVSLTLRDDVDFDMSAMTRLWKDLIRHEDAWPFMRPVKKSDVPDYYDVIKRPMDFGTMKGKLDDNKYLVNQDFLEDVRLIFDNCRLYNPSDSVVFECGEKMEEFFREKLSEMGLDNYYDDDD